MRSVYIVLTTEKLYTFGTKILADKFARRASKCPSMQEKTIRVLRAPVFKARKRSIAEHVAHQWGANAL